MTFDEFEKKIWDKGYGIAAMNHYTISGKRHTYCVVFNKLKEHAIQSEAEKSEDVFETIYNRLIEKKENDLNL